MESVSGWTRGKYSVQPTMVGNISSIFFPLYRQGGKGNGLEIDTDYDSILYDLIQTVCVGLCPSTSLSLIFTFVKCG